MVALEGLGLADRAESFPISSLVGATTRSLSEGRGGRAQPAPRRRTIRALDSVNGEAVMRMILSRVRWGRGGRGNPRRQVSLVADRVVFLRDGRAVDETFATAESRRAYSPRRPDPA